MHVPARVRLAGSVLIVLLIARDARTQAPPAAPAAASQDGASRELGQHVFLEPTLFDSALIMSYVGIRESFAFYHVPNLEAGELGSRDITLTGFQQFLDLGLRLSELFGVAGFVRGTAITGVDGSSLVLDGASVNYELAGEGILRLYHSEQSGTQLSARARIGHARTQEITILRLVSTLAAVPQSVSDVIRQGVSRNILVPTYETSLAGGLHLAQAFSRYLSLQASAGLEYGWYSRRPFDSGVGLRIDQDGTVWRVHLAGAFGVDFAASKVPVAVLAEYRWIGGDREGISEQADPGSSTVSLGVYYSGRRSLQLGVGSSLTIDAARRPGQDPEGNPRPSGRPTLSYYHLILRYVW